MPAFSDIFAEITGEAQTPLPASAASQKRKSDDELRRSSDKSVRRDPPTTNTPAATAQIKHTSPSVAASRSEPNAGVSVPSKSNTRKPSNGAGPAISTSTEPAKPPKKGSFAEILARGKAAQATLGQVGKIQHKSITKGLSRRERQELKEQEAQSARNSKRTSRPGMRAHLRDRRNGARGNSGRVTAQAPIIPEKKVKKAALATTGYTGTARPNPSAPKSESKTPSASRSSGTRQSTSSARRHTEISQEDDDDDEEMEDDYYSDASSDMEAAAFEVDEEEERAARIARKEDEEALREETRHQREKEEKRRKLVALAKSRR